MKKIDLSKWLKSLLSLTLVTALLITSGCSDDDGDTVILPTETLYELISADADLSTMLGYIDADAELLGFAQGATAYTIFAPTNTAFTNLEELLGTSLDLVAPSVIDATLRFHFGLGSSSLASITGGSITTAQGESVVVNGDGTIATGGSNSAVEVSSSDIAAINGTLHVVETILIPPTLFITIGLNLGTVAQPFLLGAPFTDVVGIIAVADSDVPTGEMAISAILADQTSGTKYTAFLPANDVFAGTAAALSITKDALIASLTPNAATARGFLLNQITDAEGLKGSDLVNLKMITMMSGVTYMVVEGTASETNPLGITLVQPADALDPTKHAPVFQTDIIDVNSTGAGINGSAHVGGIHQ